jgi:hypothetical protein
MLRIEFPEFRKIRTCQFFWPLAIPKLKGTMAWITTIRMYSQNSKYTIPIYLMCCCLLQTPCMQHLKPVLHFVFPGILNGRKYPFQDFLSFLYTSKSSSSFFPCLIPLNNRTMRLGISLSIKPDLAAKLLAIRISLLSITPSARVIFTMP